MHKFRCLILTIAAAMGGSPGSAAPLLFSGWGAGQIGLVVTTPTVNLAGNVTGNASDVNDAAVAVGSGVNLQISGGTITGALDFADAATKSTGGSCAADPGGTCLVNSASSLSGDTVTGVTAQYVSAVTNAINEWTGLVNSWSTNTGATTANLNGGAGISLCTGTFTGCTYNNSTPVTRTVNGASQTAYLFDLTSTTGGVINQNITIKGDGSALIILLYNGASTLSVAKTFTVTGGVTSDQILLNDTSAAGISTANGFTFSGAIAAKGSTETLTSAVISGRLFLYGSSGQAATVSPATAPAFALTAPADIAIPEPVTLVLIGGALVLLGKLRKRARRIT
jgi:hypothetical protein